MIPKHSSARLGADPPATTQFAYDIRPTTLYMGATVTLTLTVTIPAGTKRTDDIAINIYFPIGPQVNALLTSASAGAIAPSSQTKGWSWNLAPIQDGMIGFQLYPQAASAVPTQGGIVQLRFANIVVSTATTTDIPVHLSVQEIIEGTENDASLTVTKVTSPLNIALIPDPPTVGLGQPTNLKWSATGGTSVIIRGVGPDITIPLVGPGPSYAGTQSALPNQTVPQTTFTALIVTPDNQQLATAATIQLSSPSFVRPFTVAPTTPVDLGASVTLDWDVQYASQILLQPGTGTGFVPAKGPRTIDPSVYLSGNQSDVTFTMTPRGFKPLPAPQRVTVSFNPARILYFRYVDLADKRIEFACVNGRGAVNIDGDGLATYTVTGPGGPLVQYLGPDPGNHVQIQYFTASASSVAPNTPVTLTWVTAASTALVLQPGNIPVTSDAHGNGSHQVTPSATTTYVLVATQATTTVSSELTVTVQTP